MSLISLLRKGRYVYIDLKLPPIREQILDPRTVKVNVNAVMSDIVETHDTSTDEFVDFGRIPPEIHELVGTRVVSFHYVAHHCIHIDFHRSRIEYLLAYGWQF